MNPIVFHIASGDSFFSGIVLLFVSFGMAHRSHRILNRLTPIVFFVGALAIAVSSTALPIWIYAVAWTITAVWVISRYITSWQEWSERVTIAVWVVALAMEIPWHIVPQLDPVTNRSITVIGDSVTAGIGSEETSERWPQILRQEYRLDVQDISHIGETASSALKRVQDQEINSKIVVVEIGGNDLLGASPSAVQFATDLDHLLAHITSTDRQVVMFELPLPPFHSEFGRVQRMAAGRYGVKLIPRRRFLSILAAGGATLDTIHLSQAGHRKMVDCVWSVLESAFDSEIR